MEKTSTCEPVNRPIVKPMVFKCTIVDTTRLVCPEVNTMRQQLDVTVSKCRVENELWLTIILPHGMIWHRCVLNPYPVMYGLNPCCLLFHGFNPCKSVPTVTLRPSPIASPERASVCPASNRQAPFDPFQNLLKSWASETKNSWRNRSLFFTPGG